MRTIGGLGRYIGRYIGRLSADYRLCNVSETETEIEKWLRDLREKRRIRKEKLYFMVISWSTNWGDCQLKPTIQIKANVGF